MTQINPYDGYRIFSTQSSLGHRLFVTLRVGGELVIPPRCVQDYPPGPESDAQLTRDTFLLTAVCRYFQMGGTPWDVQMLLEEGSDFSRYVNEYTLEFPPEWQCVGYSGCDEFQTFFHNDVTDTYLVVEEDCYCEEMGGEDLIASWHRK
jgi:hypothetical protein